MGLREPADGLQRGLEPADRLRVRRARNRALADLLVVHLGLEPHFAAQSPWRAAGGGGGFRRYGGRSVRGGRPPWTVAATGRSSRRPAKRWAPRSPRSTLVSVSVRPISSRKYGLPPLRWIRRLRSGA